jgi:hypothetical protein
MGVSVISEQQYWDTVGYLSDQVSPSYLNYVAQKPLDVVMTEITKGMSLELFPVISSLLSTGERRDTELKFLQNIRDLMFLSGDSEEGFDSLMTLFDSIGASATSLSAIFPGLLTWGMKWNALVVAVLGMAIIDDEDPLE